MKSLGRHRIWEHLRRSCAAGLSLLVVALGALAVHPDFHEELHHDAQHGDHACAITLMATGADPSAPPSLTGTTVQLSDRAPTRPSDATLPAAPDFLRRPARGPPAL
jgi:hypothetical protein